MRVEKLFVPDVGKTMNAYIGGGKPHWIYRGQKNKYKKLAADLEWELVRPFDSPVILMFQPELGARRRNFDCSNYGMSYKQIEDTIRECGIIRDDSAEYVRGIIQCAPIRAEDDVEGVMVTIQAVDGSLPPEQAMLALPEPPPF